MSEGSTSGTHVVQISQTKLVDECKEDLSRLPFKFSYDGNCFRCCSTQLATHLKPFGLANEKFVPQYIKDSSAEVIRSFLDAYLKGDGSYLTGRKRYYTCSEKMANDLQELIFKAGSVSNIVRKKVAGTGSF